MPVRSRVPASIRLPLWFALIAGIPLTALAWLGWQLLAQEQSVDEQRRRERIETAATLLARDLSRALTAWEDLLPLVAQGATPELPPGTLALTFDANGIQSARGIALPYVHRVSPAVEPTSAVFAEGERLEFISRDLASALNIYRRLAASNEPQVRAGALMRVARCLQKLGRLQESVGVYDQLAMMAQTPLAGATAELVARRERIELFDIRKDADARTRSR